MGSDEVFKRKAYIIAAICSPGPLLYLIFALSGGDPLDGFAGGPEGNSYFQSVLSGFSFYFACASTVVAPIVGTIFAIRSKQDKKDEYYWTLPVIGILLPFSLMVSLYVFSFFIHIPFY